MLTEITEVAGGHTVTISDINELSEAASNISRQLRNQYILGCSPSDRARGAQLHKIKVQVNQPVPGPALHVYNKQAYFSTNN